MRIVVVLVLGFMCICGPLFSQKSTSSITIFGGAEYGFDTKSMQPAPILFRDGFFHSAGFYYKKSFPKWYIQSGIYYTQVLLSDEARTSSFVTYKVHRLGIALQTGFYLLNNEKWSIGIGGGPNLLYNIAAVKWNGDFNDSSVVHLTNNDIHLSGLEINFHGLFAWQFHKRAEVYAMPFMNINVLPVFKTNPDYTQRMGLTLGIGYTF